MCGIVGVIGTKPVAGLMVDALKRLEYRGYDSAGVATLEGGHITRRRAKGKIKQLETKLSAEPLSGFIGIGHTRWATHGKPTEENAHPHATKRVAVVHNGIIENFGELRHELEAEGAELEGTTDTVVIAHYVTREMDRGLAPVDAVRAAIPRLKGAYALAFLFDGEDDLLVGVRKGSPLAVGTRGGDLFLGSDAIALGAFDCKEMSYLEDGDLVVLRRDADVAIEDNAGMPVTRTWLRVEGGVFSLDKGNHRHFMAKEIHEQPDVVARAFLQFIDPETQTVRMPVLPFDFRDIEYVHIAACGTGFYAGLIAEYWFERYARMRAKADMGSEFRYRDVPLQKGDLALLISQSGETADTLAPLRYAKEHGLHTLSVLNVESSTMARESDAMAKIMAGPEIGVASTKAFTCQLAVLLCLALVAGKARGTLSEEDERAMVRALIEVPRHMTEVLSLEPQIEKAALKLKEYKDALYFGRGTSYPLALEGALKLKETSYIHAEGYAAGELKHGSIAIIDEHMPVIVIMPSGSVLLEKTASNIQEVIARGGKIILLTDAIGSEAVEGCEDVFVLPHMHEAVAPIVYVLVLQLLAYHTACFKGTDVDQPRNLAKSVTVE